MQRTDVTTIEDQINTLAITASQNDLAPGELAMFQFAISVAISKLLICIHRDQATRENQNN